MLQTSFIAQPTVFSTHLALHDLYNCLQLTVIYNLGLWNLMLYKYHILKTSPKVFSASKRKMEIVLFFIHNVWKISLHLQIHIQCGLSMTSWLIHTLFLFWSIHTLFTASKGYGSTKTSWTVHTVRTG